MTFSDLYLEFIRFVTQFSSKELLDYLTALVFVETALIANKAAKHNREANELRFLPILVFDITGAIDQPTFLLKNIGHAPAFDIGIEDDTFYFLDTREVYKVRMSFKDGLNLLLGSEERGLQVDTTLNGRTTDGTNFAAFLHRNRLTRKVVIRYKSSLGVKYLTQIIYVKNSSKIVRSPLRLRWWNQVCIYCASCWSYIWHNGKFQVALLKHAFSERMNKNSSAGEGGA